MVSGETAARGPDWKRPRKEPRAHRDQGTPGDLYSKIRSFVKVIWEPQPIQLVACGRRVRKPNHFPRKLPLPFLLQTIKDL